MEFSRLVPDRAGERSLDVAEQLALQEVPRDGRTVDGDERRGPAGTERMDRLGHQLFAGARLPGDQHGRVGVGDLADHGKDLLHGPGDADDVPEFGPLRQLFPEPTVLFAKAPASAGPSVTAAAIRRD